MFLFALEPQSLVGFSPAEAEVLRPDAKGRVGVIVLVNLVAINCPCTDEA